MTQVSRNVQTCLLRSTETILLGETSASGKLPPRGHQRLFEPALAANVRALGQLMDADDESEQCDSNRLESGSIQSVGQAFRISLASLTFACSLARDRLELSTAVDWPFQRAQHSHPTAA